MANSYLNIVTFLMTTGVIIGNKPNLTYDISVDPAKYKRIC